MAKATIKEQEPLETLPPAVEEAPTSDVDVQEGLPMPDQAEIVRSKHQYKDWIKMSHDEMMAAQEQGILIGYHPAKGLGLVKVKETKKK